MVGSILLLQARLLPTDAKQNVSGCIKAEAKYTDAAAMTRAVLVDLPDITYTNQSWHPNVGTLLETAESASFWKLHGFRNFAKSAALAARVPSERTNYLGRWKAEASDEYVRTSKQIILEIQHLIADQASRNPAFLDEDDTLANLSQSLTEIGLGTDAIPNQLQKRRVHRQDLQELNLIPTLQAEEATSEAAPPVLETAAELESDSDAAPMQTEDFWASGTKHRKDIKLHILGSCPSTPGINVKDFVWAATPQDVNWTTLCKKCGKGIPAPGGNAKSP